MPEQGNSMSGKRITFAIAGLGLLSTLIVVNAVYWQDGRHPAPIGLARVHKTQSPMRDAMKDDYTAKMVVRQFTSSTGKSQAGRHGKLIAEIQRELKRSGFYSGGVDGIHGAMTRRAIIAYQQRAGIKATGKPSKELLGQLRFSRMLNSSSARNSAKAGAAPDKTVELVQSGLAELGYAPGPVDGILGADTRQAIREFERDRGIKVTGTVSARLIKELRKVTGISVLNAT